MSNPAEEVKAAAIEAEANADTPMPHGANPTRPNKSVPVAVRLSPADVAAIDKLASAMNVPVSTLIRGWIQQGLAARSENTLDSAIDKISADVQRLRELVA
jgi:hypothetical protein